MDHRIQASFYDVAGATPGRVRQVRSVGSGFAALEARLPAGQAMLLGEALNPDTEFVDGLDAEPTRAERPVLAVSNGTVTVPEQALPVLVVAARQIVATWDAAGSYTPDVTAATVELRPAWPYQWQEMVSLGGYRAARIEAISAEAGRRIVADFEHDALGSPHTYPADHNSQLNGQAAAILAVDGVGEDMLCADASGAWDLRPHTADQAKAVGRAWQQRKQAIRKAYQNARLAIEAATTRAEVDAVTPAWP